jgi:ABC-type branched-subunit amino acid transport system substrate-binding protein
MAAPRRVGILIDSSAPGAGLPPTAALLQVPTHDLVESGRIEEPVEFVVAYGLGLPAGTADAVERAYEELVDQDVLLVVGPAIGDDALVVEPLASRFEVPTIQWSGTERARNEWMFQLQVGSHEDESVLLARHLVGEGCASVGVVHDESPIGRRHLEFFQAEADAIGLRVTATASIPPLADDATHEADAVLGAGGDGLVYFGLGFSAPAVADAARQRDFTGPRVMNTAGMRGHAPEFGMRIDGWTYVDMYADDNTVLASVCERRGEAAGVGPFPAFGWDLGQLVAEGLARAPEPTRDGVKHGLELIKWLPAAEGHEGTLLGFGHHQRGALHGRYLVLREWRAGVSVQR